MKQPMRLAMILFIGLLCFSSSSYAQDYRAEIIEYVIDPCLLFSVRKTGLDKKIDEKQALELLRLMTQAQMEQTITEATKLVRHKNFDVRLKLYNVFSMICINSAQKSR